MQTAPARKVKRKGKQMSQTDLIQNGVSRRSFVTAAALGGVAAAGALASSGASNARAIESTASSISLPDTWDYEADVVVLGAGGAGLPAACKAAVDGASVIVIESNWDTGGHSAVSEGNLHSGAGTDIQQKYGIVDSADQYYIDHTYGGLVVSRYNDRDYIRAIADNMVEAYDFIREEGVLVKDEEPTYSGTSAFDPDATGGSNCDTVKRQTLTDATTEGWESYRGKEESGIGITRPLERSARALGVQFLMNYHMDVIYRETSGEGRVMGVQASYTPHTMPGSSEPLGHLMTDGDIETTQQTVTVRANKGVVVCTGGSTGNLTLRTAFDPRLGPEFDGLAGMPFSDQDGSGELASMRIGASLGTMTSYDAHGGGQITMCKRVGCRYGYGSGFAKSSKVWPLVVANGVNLDLDSMVIVNMLGQRCGNSDVLALGKYNDKTHDWYDTALASVVIDPDGDGNAVRYGGPLWAIFDQACADSHDWDMEQGTVDYDNGYCFKADTLEELAQKVVNKYYEDVKMDPNTLVETITNYNSYVDAGEDPEWGTIDHLVNKVETGPFYAAWAMPNLHDTHAGLRVNPAMQVVDILGEPIPGLYAAGECSAGSRAHGHGRVITAGYIAGRSAAAGETGAAAPGAASRGDAITTEMRVYGTTNEPDKKAASSSSADEGTSSLNDGTFTGTSPNGQGGEIQVEITVESGTITGIEVTKEHETENIGEAALPTLVDEALAAQSSEIDAVAGASVTSAAFSEALETAIEKARR
jgi:urocanate reductase